MRILSRFALLPAICVTLMLGFTINSEAQILSLASNFDGTQTGFNYSSANTILNDTNPTAYQEIAQTFVISSNSNLNYILAPISYVPGSASPAISLYLETGNTSNPSGNILESWQNFSIPSSSPNDQFSTQFTPEQFTSNSYPLLTAGTTYWLIALPAVQNTLLEWNTTTDTNKIGYYANENQTNPSWTFYQGTQSNPYLSSAFAVYGTPIQTQNVPEPGVLSTLLGIGTAGVGMFLRKFRKA